MAGTMFGLWCGRLTEVTMFFTRCFNKRYFFWSLVCLLAGGSAAMLIGVATTAYRSYLHGASHGSLRTKNTLMTFWKALEFSEAEQPIAALTTELNDLSESDRFRFLLKLLYQDT